MDPITIAGLIGAGGSLLGSVINHQQSKRLQDNAFRQNVQLWHEQNAYNSPLAQVSRLRQAGLNPALAYGASGQVTGASESAPALDYGSTINQPLISSDAVMNAQNFMNGLANRKLMEKQGEKLDVDAERSRVETFDALNRGILSGARAKYAEDLAVQELRGMTARNDKTYKEVEQLDETIDNIIATRNLTKEQIEALQYANEYADRTMEARVEAASLVPTLSRAQVRELNARVGKYAAEIKLMGENIRQLQTINGYLPLTLSTNLGKGIAEIHNLQQRDKQIDQTIQLLSAETGIAEKNLKTYFLNLVLGEYHKFKGESLASDKIDQSSKGINMGAEIALASKLIPMLF